ncbi:MAG TPA: phosphocholine cytidylyltransferase family protein [Bacteroidota bacterium]
MTAVLLAAGVGSRLRPLTDAMPKCLLPLGGSTLLERTLRAFQGAGLARCLLVTGYRHEMVEAEVRRLGLRLPVECLYNALYESTNNNYSLWLAGRKAAGSGILLMDADILFDPALVQLLLEASAPDALVLRTDGLLGTEEIKVELAGSLVTRIGKDVDPSRAAGESIGIEKFSANTAQALFEVLGRRKERYEFYEASFQELIDQGTRLEAVASGDLVCMEIDTPQDLAAADLLARARRL